MDDIVANRKTVDECRKLEANAERLERPEIAKQCRQRAIQIQAADYVGADEISAPEMEAIEALMAYERILTDKNGRKTRASRTRKMFDTHGIIKGVERAVVRPAATEGFASLIESGLEQHAFEAVILRNEADFSDEAVAMSRERMKDVNMGEVESEPVMSDPEAKPE